MSHFSSSLPLAETPEQQCNLIERNFIDWSNSTPEELSKKQLKVCLSNFSSSANAIQWLENLGFYIEPPRRLFEGEEVIIGLSQPAFSLIVDWNIKKQGVIFANNSWRYAKTVALVHGITLEVLYVEPFKVHKIAITRTIL